jgi:hypothetical protein
MVKFILGVLEIRDNSATAINPISIFLERSAVFMRKLDRLAVEELILP